MIETFFGRLKTEIYYGFEKEYILFNAFAVTIEEYLKLQYEIEHSVNP